MNDGTSTIYDGVGKWPGLCVADLASVCICTRCTTVRYWLIRGGRVHSMTPFSVASWCNSDRIGFVVLATLREAERMRDRQLDWSSFRSR